MGILNSQYFNINDLTVQPDQDARYLRIDIRLKGERLVSLSEEDASRLKDALTAALLELDRLDGYCAEHQCREDDPAHIHPTPDHLSWAGEDEC